MTKLDHGRRAPVPQQIDLELNPDALLTVNTVAALYGIKPRTVRYRSKLNEMPAPVHRGRAVRWVAGEICADLRRIRAEGQAARSSTTLAPET